MRPIARAAAPLFLAASLVPIHLAWAQDAPPALPQDSVSVGAEDVPMSELRDIGDLLAAIFGSTRVQTEAELRPRPGLSIVALPSIGYNPAYGAYFGVGAAAGGWLGDPERTNVSMFALNATYSTNQQLTIQLRSDAWVEGNKWNFKGDWRYLDTNQDTYGLGPTTVQTGRYPMDFTMWRFYEAVYRRVSGNVYVGLGYHLNVHEQVADERADAGEVTPYSIYEGGTPSQLVASGVSVNVLVDSRDSPIYTRRGIFWNASLRSYNKSVGSQEAWQELQSDLRFYPILPRGSRHVLAFWSTMWMTFGHAPYLDLPAIGWDTYGKSGRGYVQGRLRAQQQLYNEVEYRMVFTRNELFGGVVFLNATTGTLPSGALGPLDPGYGIGLRMKFVKRTRTNLTLDYGWGNENSSGLYLGTQELF